MKLIQKTRIMIKRCNWIPFQKSILISVLLVGFSFAYAYPSQTDVDSFQSYIENEEWTKAIPLGEAMLEEITDEAILINLGVAYYQTNDLGRARWCFEQVLFYNPNCTVCINNIHLIRTEILEIEEEPFLLDVFKRNIYFFLSGTVWAILAIFFSILGIFMYRNRLEWFSGKQWPLILNYSVLLVLALIVIGRNAYVGSSDKVIVLESGQMLRESPEGRASIVQTVKPGNLLILKDDMEGWGQVEMTNGTEGWIELEYVRNILE